MNESEAAFNDFENHCCQNYDSANCCVCEKIDGDTCNSSQHEYDVEDVADLKILIFGLFHQSMVSWSVASYFHNYLKASLMPLNISFLRSIVARRNLPDRRLSLFLFLLRANSSTIQSSAFVLKPVSRFSS